MRRGRWLRSPALWLGLCVAGALAGALSFALLQGVRQAARFASWTQDPFGEAEPHKPTENVLRWYGEELDSELAHIDALRRQKKPWTTAEAEELLAILRRGEPVEASRRAAQEAERLGVEATPELLEHNRQLLRYNEAMIAVTERLRKDALGRTDRRVEPEARQALERFIMSGLEDGSPQVRESAWIAALESGMVERPEVRQKLEEMARSDPDEENRAYFARALAHYDNIVQLAKRYREMLHSSGERVGG